MIEIQGYVIVNKETGKRWGSCFDSTGGAKTSWHGEFCRRTGYQAYERVNAELRAEIEALRKDAGRWRAFINCARIKFFGWAGYGEKDPNGNSPGNYRHFGGEFWTIYDAPTADKEKAAEILNGFADASIAAMAKGAQS